MDERTRVIDKVKFIAEKYRSMGAISGAWIFGSFGKNTQHRTSDIDIAIECNDYTQWFHIVDEIEQIDTIRRFDIHNIGEDGGKPVFDVEGIRSGIKLC